MTTLQVLQSQFDGALLVPLVELDKTLSTTRRALYHAHIKKQLPFGTRKIGSKVMVSLSDLARWLENPEAVTPTAARTLRGRPSAVERAEAEQLGITVSDLRRIRVGHTTTGDAQ